MKGVFPMKKILSMALALVLVLSVSAGALADVVPSVRLSDLVSVEISAENLPEGVEIVFETSSSPEEIAFAKDQLAGLLIYLTEKIGKIEDFFGLVIMPDGRVTTLQKLLSSDEINLDEFLPIHVENYDPSYGYVTARFQFLTPYSPEDEVIVLIGIVEGNRVIWYGFNANGLENGALEVLFNPDILMMIQNNMSLLAVLSK